MFVEGFRQVLEKVASSKMLNMKKLNHLINDFEPK